MQSKTIKQLCEDHNVSRPFIYKEIKAGRLRTYKAGSRRKATDEAEREWIEGLEHAEAERRQQDEAPDAPPLEAGDSDAAVSL